eukprot:scaffold251642_cov32-Tisochrysis_lutea.AAC.2
MASNSGTTCRAISAASGEAAEARNVAVYDWASGCGPFCFIMVSKWRQSDQRPLRAYASSNALCAVMDGRSRRRSISLSDCRASGSRFLRAVLMTSWMSSSRPRPRSHAAISATKLRAILGGTLSSSRRWRRT